MDDFRTDESRIDVQAPEALVLVADPDRLGQALEDLLANALQHAPPGTPVRVEVAAEPRHAARCALIAVADEGPGVPEEVRPHLLERFAAGPGSTSLGLYLARQIALAHGRDLTLDPAPGRGARFVLALPVERVDR